MHVEQTTDDTACTWCGNQFRMHDLAWCSTCGQPFHLALRMDTPVQDCGQAWLSDEVEAVVFGCNRCLSADAGSAAISGTTTLR